MSNDNRTDDIIVIVDNNLKLTILFANKFLIIKKKIANLTSNTDLTKFILPTLLIFFNVLIIDKQNNAKIK